MNTYVFITEYLNEKIVDDMFKKRGNWKKILYKDLKPNTNPDYNYIDVAYPEKYPNIFSYKHNLVNKIKQFEVHQISNKCKLYLFMKKKYPKICEKYMMEQYEFNIYKVYPFRYKNLFENGKIWILRIVFGGGGTHVYVIDDYIEFAKRVKSLQKLDDKIIKSYPTFVLSEYINNPLIFNNKKFHLRMYYMFNASTQKGYLHKYGQIWTAKKDYVQKDYQNKNIHDTRFYSTKKDYYFPHEFIKLYSNNVILDIYEQLKELFHYILALTKAECLPDSKNCYEIYGADIMITEDFKVKLIEVNSRIGILTFDNKLLTEYLMEGVLETIVDPLFPPKNKQPKKNYFIEV